MPIFQRYFGLDYSGAKTPTAPLSGLRLYEAGPGTPPLERRPQKNRRIHWTRRGLAECLLDNLHQAPSVLIGIDHGFSFPEAYFDAHSLPRCWAAFLDDFCGHWPTDHDSVSVEDVRRGRAGNGTARLGNSRWRRLTDIRARAKSVFHFDVPGSVAKSTHAGLPWLRHLRDELGDRIHFWPMDGWEIPDDRSVIVEAYPSLWNTMFPREDRNSDQHDAYTIAAWMRQADHTDQLMRYFAPELTSTERAQAESEGWIFGVS